MKISLPTGAVTLLCGIFLLSLITPALLRGQDEKPRLVLLKTDRQKTLDTAEAILHSEIPDFYENLKAAHSPFIVKPEEEVVVEETPEGPKEVLRPKKPPKPKDLPDAVILKSVADRLKPKGSLVTSRRSLLLFPNGGKLRVGDTIPVTVRGKEYEIVVQAITSNDYTLRLNEAVATRSFRITSSKSTITRDSGND